MRIDLWRLLNLEGWRVEWRQGSWRFGLQRLGEENGVRGVVGVSDVLWRDVVPEIGRGHLEEGVGVAVHFVNGLDDQLITWDGVRVQWLRTDQGGFWDWVYLVFLVAFFFLK